MRTRHLYRNQSVLGALSVAASLAIWIGIERLTGEEAWDTTIYWCAGYPVEVALCAAFASVAPRRFWIWGLLMMSSLCLYSLGASFYQATIPPITIFVFAVMSLPCIGASYLASRFSEHKEKVRQNDERN